MNKSKLPLGNEIDRTYEPGLCIYRKEFGPVHRWSRHPYLGLGPSPVHQSDRA